VETVKKFFILSVVCLGVFSSLAGCNNKKNSKTEQPKQSQKVKSSSKEAATSTSSVSTINTETIESDYDVNYQEAATQAEEKRPVLSDIVYHAEINRISGKTTPKAYVYAINPDDPNAQVGTFYADTEGNFVIVSPPYGTLCKIVASVNKVDSEPFYLNIPEAGNDPSLSFGSLATNLQEGSISGVLPPNTTVLVSRPEAPDTVVATFQADENGNFTVTNLPKGAITRLDPVSGDKKGAPYFVEIP
jgi:hypothetical protein